MIDAEAFPVRTQLDILRSINAQVQSTSKSSQRIAWAIQHNEQFPHVMDPSTPRWWFSMLSTGLFKPQDLLELVYNRLHVNNTRSYTQQAIEQHFPCLPYKQMLRQILNVKLSGFGECGELTHYSVYLLLLKAAELNDLNIFSSIRPVHLKAENGYFVHSFLIFGTVTPDELSRVKNLKDFASLNKNYIIWDPLLDIVMHPADFTESPTAIKYHGSVEWVRAHIPPNVGETTKSLMDMHRFANDLSAALRQIFSKTQKRFESLTAETFFTLLNVLTNAKTIAITANKIDMAGKVDACIDSLLVKRIHRPIRILVRPQPTVHVIKEMQTDTKRPNIRV